MQFGINSLLFYGERKHTCVIFAHKSIFSLFVRASVAKCRRCVGSNFSTAIVLQLDQRTELSPLKAVCEEGDLPQEAVGLKIRFTLSALFSLPDMERLLTGRRLSTAARPNS